MGLPRLAAVMDPLYKVREGILASAIEDIAAYVQRLRCDREQYPV